MSEFLWSSPLRRRVAIALAGTILMMAPSVTVLAWSWPGSSRGSDPAATEIAGIARVVDGDTLDIDGQRVRLEGIDAPESAQVCGRGTSGTWDCGRKAAQILSELVDRRRVTCRSAGLDKYERLLGVCAVDGRDVNAEMVRRGYAWAFVKYSETYVKEEAEARAARAGIWQGEAQPAWLFRANRWQSAETDAPNGCAIKGNITENGHIYHMPWSPWYGRVKVDPSRGERWFCSEAEAQNAGWRAAVSG